MKGANVLLAYVGAASWVDFIGITDFLLLPFYIILVYFIALRFCNSRYPSGHPWRSVFLNGFSLKILGAIFISLVYQYYYRGGDTSAFFYHGQVINSALKESFIKWVNLLFGWPSFYSSDYYEYISQMMWYSDKSSYPICGITAFISIFGFNTFLPTAVLFAALSYTGNWAMFRAFASRYPKYSKQIGWAVLYIPSTFVWGSGIFKDTVCLAALGWITYAAFQLLIIRRFSLSNILTLVISFYLISFIKIYILLAFSPALLLWISFTYTQRIRNAISRFFFKIMLGVVSLGVLAFVGATFADSLGKYSFSNLANTLDVTSSYIYQTTLSDGGSGYNLGELELTPLGIATKFLPAVNVTLFRPYIWESTKPMVLLNAIEASFFLFFTLRLLFVVGPRRIWRKIKTNPDLQFFFIFTLIFAFAIGISTFNFGALSRYRIPCLPFYALGLFLLYYSRNDGDELVPNTGQN